MNIQQNLLALLSSAFIEIFFALIPNFSTTKVRLYKYKYLIESKACYCLYRLRDNFPKKYLIFPIENVSIAYTIKGLMIILIIQ